MPTFVQHILASNQNNSPKHSSFSGCLIHRKGSLKVSPPLRLTRPSPPQLQSQDFFISEPQSKEHYHALVSSRFELNKYAEFSGRARRAEYWLYMLIHILVLAVLIIVMIHTFFSRNNAFDIVAMLLFIYLLIT